MTDSLTPPFQPPYTLGIDLGGTFIKAGLLDANLRVVERCRVATPVDRTPDSVLNTVAQICRNLCTQTNVSHQDLAGVGLGVPGPVDASAGVVLFCTNLTDWNNIEAGTRLNTLLDWPVTVENDANAAAYGEYRIASTHDLELHDAVLITLGTGIGGGVILNGQVVRGHNLAGEIGHMIVEAGSNARPCGCGQFGCLETYASASGLVKSAQDHMQHPPGDAAQLFAAAVSDPQARQIIEVAMQKLAIACLNIARLINPQIIFIGGGVAAAGQPLIDPLQKAFDLINWSIPSTAPRFELAHLGNDAGMIGVAALAQAGHLSTVLPHA